MNAHRPALRSAMVGLALLAAAPAPIAAGEWQHIRVEVVGRVCHFYVGDMTNDIVLRVRGGTCASGGFFARLVR